MIITAVVLLIAASIGLVGQTNGQVTTLPSSSEGPTPNDLPSNVRSTEIITNGTTGVSMTEGSNNTSNPPTIATTGVAANATIDNQTTTIQPNLTMQQQRPLSQQQELSSLQPLSSQVAKRQTFQVPGPIQQTSGNISSASSSILSFSEYNNSKYGFKIQYPSDWQIISIANGSLSSSITGTPTDVIVRIRSPPDPQNGTQDLLTISVENISAASPRQANRNLTAYDYASPIIGQLPFIPRAATEGNQTNLIKNESVSIASESNSNNNNNLSAWRLDYIALDYKSEVFVINDTKVFNIAFSTPKERATQSLPIFDKMLDSFRFIRTTTNAIAAEDTLNTTDVRNATAINNQTTTAAVTIPSNQTVQEQQQPPPLLQPPSGLIPPPSQQQPSTFQTEQQTIMPPPSNATQLQQQQPPLGQVIQQQQPIYQQQPLDQQLLQQQQQPSTMQQQVPLTQPFIEQPSSQQFQTQQPFVQAPPQPSTLVQPGASPTAGTTLQPQVSALPPSATTFPPSIYPPVSSLQPYGSNTGFYPSTTSGYPYGTPAGMPFSTTGITSVSASQQIISPWFPSLPAISCGGTFALTVEGTPRGSDDNDDKITPSDKDDDRDGDDDDKKYSGKSNRRLALQINSDNSQIFTDEDAIYGQIFQGQKNIDQNKANDFDIKSVFNDCQIVTYSKQ